MFQVERVHYSSTWCKGMVALLRKVRGGQPPAHGCEVAAQTRASQHHEEERNGGTGDDEQGSELPPMQAQHLAFRIASRWPARLAPSPHGDGVTGPFHTSTGSQYMEILMQVALHMFATKRL